MTKKAVNEQRKITMDAINFLREKFHLALREDKPLLGFNQLYDKIYKQIEAKIKAQLDYKEVEQPQEEELPPMPAISLKSQSTVVVQKPKVKFEKPVPQRTKTIVNKSPEKPRPKPKEEAPPIKKQEEPKPQPAVLETPKPEKSLASPPLSHQTSKQEVIEEESEVLSEPPDEEEPSVKEQPAEEPERIVDLPKLHAITQMNVPPQKYKDRSIAFEIDYD